MRSGPVGMLQWSPDKWQLRTVVVFTSAGSSDTIPHRHKTTVCVGAAAMHQVADWLKQLGMSEYAQRFAENRIDLSVLPDLTDQHLKDLGIALGDRLKMLRAIRELSGEPGMISIPCSAAFTHVKAGNPPRRPPPSALTDSRRPLLDLPYEAGPDCRISN
jgi:SAM domain (Sterile alpha motif)